MFIVILSVVILYYQKLPLMLSLNDARVSEISNAAVAESTKPNTYYSDKLNTSMFEIYPVLIQPNLILQICLKDTLLLDKLHAHVNDCNNYSCMFAKVIENASLKSVASILRNDTIDVAIGQEFKQSIQDCLVWWKLFKHFEKRANPRRELGRCLFQTFSFKCKNSVLDKIRLLLITEEEDLK